MAEAQHLSPTLVHRIWKQHGLQPHRIETFKFSDDPLFVEKPRTVIGECTPRHRSKDFVRFLNRVDRETPPDLDLHLVIDNLSAHKSPAVKRWLQRHPRFHSRFTPTSSSWLNLVERWFGEITRKPIRRGVYHSVPELIAAIETYLAHDNENPKIFTWTKDADTILAKIKRCKASAGATH